MTELDWIYLIFVFMFGCCIGSFLNVVIYRLPRDKSLVRPGSACPACGKGIRFYDNIPLLSWLLLGAKCRYCKSPISARYFIVELLTGLVFIALFYLYFYTDFRSGIPSMAEGGWLIFLAHIVLFSVLIAASAIDLQLWIIPISICWFAMVAGLLFASFAGYIISVHDVTGYALLPYASTITGSLAAGAAVGTVISLVLMGTGLIRRSYETDESFLAEAEQGLPPEPDDKNFNHRLEACREILFLLPIIGCAALAYWFLNKNENVHSFWVDLLQYPAVGGFFGALWGYFVGCTVVWATRILGTFAFGKEAMGLGDVHLMGAAGAFIGPVFVVVAFFVAPFFGLGWAVFQMLSKKIRQIPYGPFLSLGILTVMILHDAITEYLQWVFYR